MITTRSSWFEVWDKHYCGTKLVNTYGTCQFNNQREAKKAIKKSVLAAKNLGYKSSDWVLMIVDTIHTMDDEGNTISITKTVARI